MKAEMTIELPIRVKVTGEFHPVEPAAGYRTGRWEATDIKPDFDNFDEYMSDLLGPDDWEAAEEALERAAQSELETAQEP